MQFVLKASQNGNTLNLTVTAEVLCTAPDGKKISVWKDSQQIASCLVSEIQSQATIDAVKDGLRNFFYKFADAVREARDKVAPK